MKKQISMIALVTAILMGGWLSAGAETTEATDAAATETWQSPGAREGRGPGRHLERKAEILGLSDAQQEQIRAIHQAERQAMEPLRQQLAADRDALQQLIEADTFDEAAVRALATAQSQLRSELMVLRARIQHQTYALLTPEQRELAKRLGPMLDGPRPHKGPF